MTQVLSLFREDEDLYKVFSAVAEERKIRFEDLLGSLHMDREDTLERLGRLEEAGLLKRRESAEEIEDRRWYYVTAEGLTWEPELRKLRDLQLV